MKSLTLTKSGVRQGWLVLMLSGFMAGFISAAPPSESLKPSLSKRPSGSENYQQRSQLSQLARQAERMEDWEGALKLWMALWHMQPGDYSAYSGIKRCYLKLNLYDEALKFLDQAAYDQRSAPGKIDPTLMAGDRVEILLTAGREKEAQEAVTEALRRFATNPNMYRSLFSVFSKFRLFEQGEAILRKGRDILGNPHLFAPELAYQAEQRMDWAQATQEHLNYLKEDPLRLPSVVNMISAYIENPGADTIVNMIIKSHLNSADERFRAVILRLQ
ncbi:MAG: tetratricopeptide repeat protein, partial [bacterium]